MGDEIEFEGVLEAFARDLSLEEPSKFLNQKYIFRKPININ